MLKPSLAQEFKTNWNRCEYNGKAIYMCTRDANWFVPNPSGDAVLSALERQSDASPDPDTRLFLSGIPQQRPEAYKGNAHLLHSCHLNELWFHITNRCNLSCTHCLFSSSPADDRMLSGEQVVSIAGEAYQDGCRLFALTGGEPFVHPDIDTTVSSLLALPESHVAVLTNGMTVAAFIERLNPDPDFFHIQISDPRSCQVSP